jgi:hypothetical protein
MRDPATDRAIPEVDNSAAFIALINIAMRKNITPLDAMIPETTPLTIEGC